MSEQTNTAIWIYADLDVSPIGTRSRLADDLAGIPVLTRTVGQLCKTDKYEAIVVFCPKSDVSKVDSLLNINDNRLSVVGLDNSVKSKYVKYRKWAIESWRGGIGEITQFDEDTVSAEMVKYGIENKHNVVLICPAASAVIDPDLLDGMYTQYYEVQDKMRFCFSQSPPGLCGCMYRLDLLHNLVHNNLGIGDVISYNPEAPHSDHIAHDCAYKVGENIYSCFSRFIVDNWRSQMLVSDLLAFYNEAPAAEDMVAFANNKTNTGVYEFPREIEVEISCTPSLRYVGYPHTVSNRQGWKCNRSSMDISLFQSIVDQSSSYDDMCITFGGFGEPLSHPDFLSFVDAAKKGGLFGVNIETDGLFLTPDFADKLIDVKPDVITIHIDAWTENTWLAVKGKTKGFENVISNVEYILEKSQGTDTAIVCSMVKTHQTFADMEPFYDQWRNKHGVSIIKGYNDYCGLTDDKNVMNMRPPARHLCNSLFRQMMILADGSVVQCGQDYAGISVLGNAKNDNLKNLWIDGILARLRLGHSQGIFDSNVLCKKCKEWFR